MPDQEKKNTQEPANMKRLVNAGLANDDPLTIGAGVTRAVRLTKQGMTLDLTAAKILGLDKLPKDDD